MRPWHVRPLRSAAGDQRRDPRPARADQGRQSDDHLARQRAPLGSRRAGHRSGRGRATAAARRWGGGGPRLDRSPRGDARSRSSGRLDDQPHGAPLALPRSHGERTRPDRTPLGRSHQGRRRRSAHRAPGNAPSDVERCAVRDSGSRRSGHRPMRRGVVLRHGRPVTDLPVQSDRQQYPLPLRRRDRPGALSDS